MKIFLSCEAERPASKYIAQFFQEFDPLLKKLENKNYGDELVDIAIISMSMSKETLANWYGERKLFKRKTKEADIRLIIDFEQFINATSEERKKIYIDHIIKSIETLREKVSRDYKFNELIADVTEMLTKSS